MKYRSVYTNGDDQMRIWKKGDSVGYRRALDNTLLILD
jgi:hypothetical protein